MSIWDSFAATGRNVVGQETGEVACDHYNRWPEDLDLLKDAALTPIGSRLLGHAFCQTALVRSINKVSITTIA